MLHFNHYHECSQSELHMVDISATTEVLHANYHHVCSLSEHNSHWLLANAQVRYTTLVFGILDNKLPFGLRILNIPHFSSILVARELVYNETT